MSRQLRAAASAPRSSIGTAFLVIAGIVVGLLGELRVLGPEHATVESAHRHRPDGGSSTGAATPASGREFSEQAVTPPAPQATDSAATGRGGGKPEAPHAVTAPRERRRATRRARRPAHRREPWSCDRPRSGDAERTLGWQDTAHARRSAVPPLRRPDRAAGIRGWNGSSRSVGRERRRDRHAAAEVAPGFDASGSPGSAASPRPTPRPAPRPRSRRHPRSTPAPSMWTRGREARASASTGSRSV